MVAAPPPRDSAPLGHVLVVDDDSALAEMLGIVLTKEGWRVTTCGDGARALTAFRAVNPDLVLLDVMLPGMDGIEFIEHLARRQLARAVLVVSEERGSMRIALGGRLGPDLTPVELREQLRALVYEREDLAPETPAQAVRP